MIYWGLLLHFYQPPTQLGSILRKVAEESYRPLIALLRKYPHARVTVNLCGVLSEMLWESGCSDVLQGLRELAEGGQVEFTGTGKFHPILPLIPKEEMRRQISANLITNRHFLGDAFAPKGFFPPEMAYSREILEPVLELGHSWIVLSGVACPGSWPRDVIYETLCNGERLAVLFRDDLLSNLISFRQTDSKGFPEQLRRLRGTAKDIYVITAMDAETFGHHIPGWDRLFLGEVYAALVQESRGAEAPRRGASRAERVAAEVKAVTLSELVELFPKGSPIEPLPSSWSTTGQDIEAGNPYPLWKDKDNPLHALQWEHLGIAMDLVAKAGEVAETEDTRRFAAVGRQLLDEALHSCQFWWASHRPMWDINMVSRGLMLQEQAIINAYKAINASACSDQIKTDYYYKVVAARDLSNKIVDKLFIQ